MTTTTIENRLKERILILDGAIGTLLQRQGLTEADFRGRLFPDHPVDLKGNNDILNLTAPGVIERIHLAYIEAGADIIETNTFNSNALSQSDYACRELVYQLNAEGARIARRAAATCTHRPVFVAGSIGPTSRSLTLASDATRPEYRAVDFDEMVAVYREQVCGLIDGGVDLLLLETVFDSLTAKAALYAISCLQEERGTHLPVMVSATINDASGRTLTGQSLGALYNALSHYPLLSFGINCSFGATELQRFVAQLAPELPVALSIYPNAGLPDELGEYDELPGFTAARLREMAEKGLINIAGGCCGTTPDHIRAIRRELEGIVPRQVPGWIYSGLTVSGLEPVTIKNGTPPLTLIGERSNVAGSAKFARLIREKQYAAAAEIARKQVEGGASILDINMDDAMLESAAEMTTFTRYISNEPEIARAALMIDSSDWDTLLAGLKNAPGKSIVNSLSLKAGEEVFLAQAREVHRLGAAVVVMAFDETGQAATYRQKIEIAGRAYHLLTGQAGFRPENIIFDVNVLSIGTGIEAHNRYAVDFIEAVRWIKQHLPGCYTSGGISNLSFAFRGNNPVREAMHAVFLYHAVQAGLDMAIVNPAILQVYDEIDPTLLQAVEDVVLDRTPEATDRLIALAESFRREKQPAETGVPQEQWRTLPLEERLGYALSRGVTEYLPADLSEALIHWKTPVEIIEGPLMRGMEQVGERFGAGKMFLPQVVKSARVMRQAVELLQPVMKAQNENDPGRTDRRPRVVIATVKGDVHDIGKNIVGIVLSCNNLDVIDLGVMVDHHTIVAAAREHRADVIGVSGLITPSLAEMEKLCRLLQEEQLEIPLIVGGATTSAVHTAVRLAPLYDYCVVEGGDASRTATRIKHLLRNRTGAIREIRERQEEIRCRHEASRHPLPSLETARQQAPRYPLQSYRLPAAFGEHNLTGKHLDIGTFSDRIDWTPFFHFWGFKGKYPGLVYSNEAAEQLYEEAIRLLGGIIAGQEFDASVIVHFYEGCADGDDLVLEGRGRLPMLRRQEPGDTCLSLADFVPPLAGGITTPVGLFCLKVSDKLAGTCRDESERLLRESLCARVTEALAVWMQEQLSEGLRVIRPAFGYPACPDHTLKREVISWLDATREIGVSLTETCAMLPTTSLCGLLMAHPEARYFSLGRISDEQRADYARRRGVTAESLTF